MLCDVPALRLGSLQSQPYFPSLSPSWLGLQGDGSGILAGMLRVTESPESHQCYWRWWHLCRLHLGKRSIPSKHPTSPWLWAVAKHRGASPWVLSYPAPVHTDHLPQELQPVSSPSQSG